MSIDENAREWGPWSVWKTEILLGGYLPLPFLSFIPAPLWMAGKIGALAFVIIWLRATYPRLREDQLQRFAWAVLVPIALLDIMITAVTKVAF